MLRVCIRSGLTPIAAFSFAVVPPALAQSPPYDLLLKNGRVVDGTGSPWYRADVAIKGDVIVRIASSITDPAARVIDVRGQVIAAGFIDIHSHARRGAAHPGDAPQGAGARQPGEECGDLTAG